VLNSAGLVRFGARVVPVVSFATGVQPVLQTRCAMACHNYSSGLPAPALATFAYASANSALILDRVTTTDPYRAMPRPGQPELTATELQTIEDWVAGGARP